MKNHFSLFFIAALTIISSVNTGSIDPQADLCYWKDEQGREYDLSRLQQQDHWQVKDSALDSDMFSVAYIFNFCSTAQSQCNGVGGAFIALDVLGQLTDSCELIGRIEKQQKELIDIYDPNVGIQVTYLNGAVCENSENPSDIGKPKTITFMIQCANYDEENFSIEPVNSITTTSCNYQMNINHRAGCYLGSSQSGTWTFFGFIWFVIQLFGLYMLGGFLYLKYQSGLQGRDAVPHYELICRIFQGFRNIFQHLLELAKEKVRGSRNFAPPSNFHNNSESSSSQSSRYSGN